MYPNLLLFLITISSLLPAITGQTFPKIDLGYAIHTPTFINTTESGAKIGLYNNIRFAQPPTGNLRFRKPVTPPSHENGIQDGRDRLTTSDCVSTVHPQAPFPGINGTSWGQEDCLFLNVWVPEGVREGDNVPVMHWLHGSAFAFGSKDMFGDGFGLMESTKGRDDRFIFVASNYRFVSLSVLTMSIVDHIYRMGLYGWVSSAHEDMDANVGLHDGIAALEWTKKYISRFGGDPANITVGGQSAGAAMIAMMLVGNGGNGTLPFQKAFLSSPALMPRRNVTERRQEVYDQVLQTGNCSSLACLRNAPPPALATINKKALNLPGASGGGTLGPGIGIGPFPDGKYLLDAVPVMLQQGRYHKNIKAVMSGNMAAEGFGMTTDVSTYEDFATLVRRLVPEATNATVGHIRDMYPFPDSQIQLAANSWTTDAVFACNARAVAKAYGNRTQRYLFSVPPAIHGLDSFYYFYRSGAELPVPVNVSLARQFQSEVVKFTTGKSKQDNRTSNWPLYAPGAKMINVTLEGIEQSVDPSANCEIILKTIMDKRNGA
ncbi:putative carboxyl ester lipase, zebrafish [Aspergillus nomiae NRRL 13137]|uniref:Carboxylic ester hydrolase n=1 Tax=Aspergillus nomiae NRRL (strain ATCC 15546 / NRRL 13137 / CBS 260.88 / M93) TaxID=1509407 RepID=A0A0L1IWZ4_ASPN3|nr:putative carboxyl ester lipase, zebrafish [Aspergillus nomiae NRRL 13137]KNG83713.1 putative carboxyl ester lipase, zebrafish [Aspergillus nomiae NRRL 13137]